MPLFPTVWFSLELLALALVSLSWNAAGSVLPPVHLRAPCHNPQTWKGSGSCWASQETLEKQQAEVLGQHSTAWHQVGRLWCNKQAQASVRRCMQRPSGQLNSWHWRSREGPSAIWNSGRASTTCSVGNMVHLSLLHM